MEILVLSSKEERNGPSFVRFVVVATLVIRLDLLCAIIHKKKKKEEKEKTLNRDVSSRNVSKMFIFRTLEGKLDQGWIPFAGKH